MGKIFSAKEVRSSSALVEKEKESAASIWHYSYVHTYRDDPSERVEKMERVLTGRSAKVSSKNVKMKYLGYTTNQSRFRDVVSKVLPVCSGDIDELILRQKDGEGMEQNGEV